jgi:hypothetical protein
MKWYWMMPKTPRTDVFLLHEYDRRTGETTLLPRFANLRCCPACRRFDEQHVLEIGFDEDRILSVPTDFWGDANDWAKMIVRESVRELLTAHDITGIDYIRCGRTRKGVPLYLFWPTHFSRTLALPAKWCYNRPTGEDLDEGCCVTCLRSRHTLGLPYHDQLEYPDLKTISVPDEPSECNHGRRYMYICSEFVRNTVRKNKLSGVSITVMQALEKHYPRSTNTRPIA